MSGGTGRYMRRHGVVLREDEGDEWRWEVVGEPVRAGQSRAFGPGGNRGWTRMRRGVDWSGRMRLQNGRWDYFENEAEKLLVYMEL